MRDSEIQPGQSLASIICPRDAEGDCSFARIGSSGVTSILVVKLAGPNGHYLAARCSREARSPFFIPLHQADYIELA